MNRRKQDGSGQDPGQRQADTHGHDIDQHQEFNTDFMREEIRQRPVNKKKLLRRTLTTAFLAVLFGAIACAVFIFLEPVISEMMNPTKKAAPVSFTEGTTEEEMNPEDMIASDEQIQEQAAEEKAANSVDAIKQEVLNELEQELAARGITVSSEDDGEEEEDTDMINPYEGMYDSFLETVEVVQKSLVTVTGITPDYDWAGDAFNDSNSGSGLLIAEKGTDLLILAGDEDYDTADRIRVTFHDGQQADAKILSVDPVTGLVVLTVSENELDAALTDNENIEICQMGSSARADLLGKPVIALGSPAGSQGSVSYGVITNSDLALDVVDSSFTQITTDIYGSTKATGVLVNTAGEVIGWVDMGINRSDSPNLIRGVGITGIKPLIEKMSNEMHAGFLGVHCTDVPEEISREQGIPEGAYVIRTDIDSPAMDGGIQSGDVITDVGGSRISSFDVLMSILGQSRAGRQLNITVMRANQNVYRPVNLSVTLTERLIFPEE